MVNTQCSANAYCEKALGNCDETGSCKPKPIACPIVYDPACGCDGKTYGNECAAAMAGVSILHQGECESPISCIKNEDCNSNDFCLFSEGTCSGPGTCTSKPNVCPLAPCSSVCGCDGNLYCSHCEAYMNGVSIFKAGPCSVEQECIRSGGKITTAMCCKSAGDFPNTCAVGACGCAPENSHQVNICDCGTGKCFDGNKCVSIRPSLR